MNHPKIWWCWWYLVSCQSCLSTVLCLAPGLYLQLWGIWSRYKLLLAGNQAKQGLGRSSGSAVGWERLGWERFFRGESMWVGVDKPEDTRGTLSKSHHIKHHHVSQKFTNSEIKKILLLIESFDVFLNIPWTRCTKWATSVFATAATSWISTSETKSHPLGLV